MIKNTFFEMRLNKNQILIKTWFKFYLGSRVNKKYFHICATCAGVLTLSVDQIIYNYIRDFGLHGGDYGLIQFEKKFIKHICFRGELICMDCNFAYKKINNFGYECWTTQQNEEQLTKIRKERAFC